MILAAALSTGCLLVIDGFISGASALIAKAICPKAVSFMIAGHRSFEQGRSCTVASWP